MLGYRIYSEYVDGVTPVLKTKQFGMHQNDHPLGISLTRWRYPTHLNTILVQCNTLLYHNPINLRT